MFAAMQYRIEISTSREGVARIHLPGRSLELDARGGRVQETPQSAPPPRPAAIAYAVEFAGDGRRHARRRLPDQGAGAEAGRVRAVRHLDPGKPQEHQFLRLLRAGIARCPSAVV